MNELVSIIVPVYNVEPYIRRCLDSIIGQTYTNLEIILIDDGSTDQSGAICDEYAAKDQRIRVIHQENGGVCAARNAGMKLVHGAYVGFVDPDDWCERDMFEYLLTNAQAQNTDITCCRYYRVIEGKNTSSRCDGVDRVYTPEEAVEELVKKFVIRNVFWNKLFKKEVFDGVEFPEGRIYEGTAMIYKLIEKANKVQVLGSPKYYYYRNDNSYIYEKKLQNTVDYVIAHLDRYIEMYQKYPRLEKKLMDGLVEVMLRLKDEIAVLDKETRKELEEQSDIIKIKQFCKEYKEAVNDGLRRLYQKDGDLISVIVPVYNVEKFLKKCLDSLLTQTYRNLEIILIEDGSPDNSAAICDAYAEKDFRIKVIHQENKGLCGARNSGMRAATGEYIGFIDSDDWLAPDMYEYLMNKLKGYEADIVSCRYYRVVPGKNTTARCDGEDVCLNKDEAIRELINRFVLRSTYWNKLFRREMFEGFEFPEGRTFEGTFTMHKVMENAEKIVMLGDPKYYYYDNETSIVNTKNIRNGMNYVVAYMTRYNYLVEKYPDLQKKMMKDAVSAIMGLRYICKNITEEEIEANKEDLQMVQQFIDENREYIFAEISKSKTDQKVLLQIRKLTPKGFKKAHRIAGYHGRLSKVKNAVLNKKKKKGRKPITAPAALTEEQEQILKELQKTLVEILDEIARICDKHGLKYYLYGGTLLGAVRNQGIIPWDDDMDIVMPREDYEKFKKICETELGEEYFYQDSFTDPGYPNIAAKIRKNNTYIREEKWDDRELHKGIFVDILPLDYFPKNNFIGNMVLHYASFLHQLIAFKYCHSKKLIVRLLYKIFNKLPMMTKYRMRHKFLTRCNKWSSKQYVCSFGSHYRPMRMRVLNAEWFGEGVPMVLEGKEYRAPSMWESYLLHLYGEDYMELPPVDKRICHSDLDSIRFNIAEEQNEEV